MPIFSLPLGAAFVIITATTAIVWTILAWLIRLFIRFRIYGPWGWDDIQCSIATAFAILQSALTILQTRYGLGRHGNELTEHAIHVQHVLAWVNNMLLILTLGFSMLSVCFLVARVTKRTEQVRIAYGVAGATGLWAVVCVFLVAFQCRLPEPWKTQPHSRCMRLYHVWLGIDIVKALLELANILAAVVLLSSVRMPLKPKAIVLAAFSIRLLVIPPTLARLHYLHRAWTSTDWSYSRIDVQIITQIVLHVSVILATVPCIRPYLAAFESGSLQAPGNQFRRARETSRGLSLATFNLPVPAQTFAAHRSKSDTSTSIMQARGKVGHRRRMEAWRGPMESSTVTTVEHDPVEAREASRKRSVDSSSSKGITRTKSFSIDIRENPEAARAKAHRESEGRIEMLRRTSGGVAFDEVREGDGRAEGGGEA